MAKDRRPKQDQNDVNRGAVKPITWYADPKDRRVVDDIAQVEGEKDGRPCGTTHVITLAVRAFSQLYKENPAQALALARNGGMATAGAR